MWLVDFSAGAWCGPCSQLKPAVRRAAGTLDGVAKVGLVDCDKNKGLCERVGVTAYPALRYYTPGGPSAGTAIESDWNVRAEILLSIWAEGALAGASARGGPVDAGDAATGEEREAGQDGASTARRTPSGGYVDESDQQELELFKVFATIAAVVLCGAAFLIWSMWQDIDQDSSDTGHRSVAAKQQLPNEASRTAAARRASKEAEESQASVDEQQRLREYLAGFGLGPTAAAGLIEVGVCSLSELGLLPLDLLDELSQVQAFGPVWSGEEHRKLQRAAKVHKRLLAEADGLGAPEPELERTAE